MDHGSFTNFLTYVGKHRGGHGQVSARQAPTAPRGRADKLHLLSGYVLTIDKKTKGRIFQYLTVQDNDQMMPLSLLDEIRKPDSGAMVNCAFGLPMTRLAQCNLTGTRIQKKGSKIIFFIFNYRVSNSKMSFFTQLFEVLGQLCLQTKSKQILSQSCCFCISLASN